MQPPIITSVLLDISFVALLLLAGIACGWLIANIIYHAKLRRIRIETWREAARKYHDLLSRAYRNAAQPQRKLP